MNWKRQTNIYSHIIAPLPPQFRQTGLSFPSKAIASDSEVELPMFTNAMVEHKHAMHFRRVVNISEPCILSGNIYPS